MADSMRDYLGDDATPSEVREWAEKYRPELHWPFVPKHDNCVECDREYEKVPVRVEREAEHG